MAFLTVKNRRQTPQTSLTQGHVNDAMLLQLDLRVGPLDTEHSQGSDEPWNLLTV